MLSARVTGVFYEQRGPLVFSASLHLVLLVSAAIWLLFSPEEEPEEFNFELVPPPAPSAVAVQKELPTLEEIVYEPEPVEPLPTLEDIQLPERPPIEVVVEQPSEPLVEVEETPPQRKMTLEEARKLIPNLDQVKNQRTTPTPSRTVELDFKPEIPTVQIDSAVWNELPVVDAEHRSERQQYIASFIAMLQSNVADHPVTGRKRVTLVSCDILANGRVTNIRILKSSGDPAYDQKVKQAYERIGVFAKPPRGIALPDLRIDFVQTTRG